MISFELMSLILTIAKRKHRRGSKKIIAQGLEGDIINEQLAIKTDNTATVTNNDGTEEPADDNNIGKQTRDLGDSFNDLQSGILESVKKSSTIDKLQLDEATAFDLETRQGAVDVAIDVPTIALLEEEDAGSLDDAVVGRILNVLPAEGSIDSAATESIDGKVTEPGHEMETAGNKATYKHNETDTYIVTEL